MKKTIFIIAISLFSVISFSSCTSEKSCEKCSTDSTSVVTDSLSTDSTSVVIDSSLVDTTK